MLLAARPGRRPLPVPRGLATADGIRVEAVHDPHVLGDLDLCFVVAHGFTGTWRRPAVRAISERLTSFGGVVGFDFRGHGRSGGASTVGDLEVLDLDAAVAWARWLGYRRVATVGWSMGGSVALRHAARPPGTRHRPDVVVSVSAPSRWQYRGTVPMRRLHLAVESRAGRAFSRVALRTRVGATGWDPVPLSPVRSASVISPVPLLVVHGDDDHYFPLTHARAIYAAAGDPRALWVVSGYAHAEAAAPPWLVSGIGRWVTAAAAGAPEVGEHRLGRDGPVAH